MVYPAGLFVLTRARTWILLAMIVISSTLVGADPEWSLGPLGLSSQGAVLGLNMVMRALIIIIAVTGIVSSVPVDRIGAVLERVGLRGMGFAVGVAFNLLPLVQRSLVTSWQAMRLRAGLRRPFGAAAPSARSRRQQLPALRRRGRARGRSAGVRPGCPDAAGVRLACPGGALRGGARRSRRPSDLVDYRLIRESRYDRQGVSMEVTRYDGAPQYVAPKHHECYGLPLQGFEVSKSRTFWMGISHFLPTGGAEQRPPPRRRSTSSSKARSRSSPTKARPC